MSKYQAYPEYQDSGIEWLKEIPKDWSIVPLKYLAELTPKKSELEESIMSNKCTFLPMEKLKLNSITLDEIRTVKDVYDGYTYFKNGDVLIAKVTPCFENKNMAIAAGLTNGIGFGSSEIYVLRPNDLINNRFLYYRLQEDNFMAVATGAMTGSGGLKRVPSETVNNFTIAIPTTNDQTQIAAFLDHETAKTDTLIEKQQQLIELLKEKRQAVISHAVTKGLNPDAPMKDSGVEWLGEVPEHWVVAGFKKYLSSIVDYRGKTPNKVDSGKFLITARNIKKGKIDYSLSQEYVSLDDYADVMSRGIPELGDVLFTTEAPLGEVAQIDNTDIALAQRIIKFRGQFDVLDNKYLKYFIMSNSFQDSLMTFASGSTALGIKAERLVYLRQLIPPINEQNEIVNHISFMEQKLNNLEKHAQQTIQLMQERRTALISAAVTGKIDVRHWVAPTTSSDTNEPVQEATA